MLDFICRLNSISFVMSSVFGLKKFRLIYVESWKIWLMSAPSLRQARLLNGYLYRRSAFYTREKITAALLDLMVLKKKRGEFLIIDAGANIGYTAIGFSRMVEGATVLGFELDRSNFSHLIRNVRPFDIQVFNIGLGDVFGRVAYGFPNEVVLREDTRNTGLLSIGEGREKLGLCTTLDGCTSSSKYSVLFVKIDCEGYEAKILAGAESLIREHLPLVVLENNCSLINPKELREKLRWMVEMGYQLFADRIFESLEGTDCEIWCIPFNITLEKIENLSLKRVNL